MSVFADKQNGQIVRWDSLAFLLKRMGNCYEAVVTVSIVLVFLALVYGEETYKITGEVSFQYDGDIYVCIFKVEESKILNCVSASAAAQPIAASIKCDPEPFG